MKCPWFHSNQWISPEKQVDDRVADGDKSASSFLSLSLSISISFFSPTSFTTSLAFLCVGLLLPFSILGFFLFLFFLCRARPRLPKKNIERPCSSSSSSSRSCDHKELFCASHFTRETERERERENERNVDLSMPSTFYLPSCTEFFFPQRPFRHFRFLVLFFFTIFFFKCRSRKGKRRRVLPDSFLFFLFK